MGECEINEKPVIFLADTGSNKTIINKKVINFHNNKYDDFNKMFSQLKDIKHTSLESRVKIKIGEWIFSDVLISKNLVKKCIIGMDILSICPPTKDFIHNLKAISTIALIQLDSKDSNTTQISQSTRMQFSKIIKITLIFITSQTIKIQPVSTIEKKTKTQIF